MGEMKCKDDGEREPLDTQKHCLSQWGAVKQAGRRELQMDLPFVHESGLDWLF